MAQDNKICGVCGELGHSKFYCKQRKRKPIKQQGKQAIRWQDFRLDWLKRHTQAVFTCGICGLPVQREVVTLDHVKPRSGNPELRYVDSNIQPACYLCNMKKGSSRNTTKYDTM